jgi:hypothetical protein
MVLGKGLEKRYFHQGFWDLVFVVDVGVFLHAGII